MDFDVTPVTSPFANAYLLTGSRVALVDTLGGSGYRKIEKVLLGRGLSLEDVDYILITHHHFDHAGSAARIKEASGALVVAGAGDEGVIDGSVETPAPSRLSFTGRALGKVPARVLGSYQGYPRVTVDRVVSDGDEIEELGLEVVGVPGHTEGGVCYFDRAGRRAFAGDIVSNYLGRAGIPMLSFSSNLEEILESQQKLADLGIEELYPGHGAVMRGGASEKICEFLAKKRK